MDKFKLVKQKLEAFISKYYKNQVLKGSILFVAVGLLYLLFTALIEHFFWLDVPGRRILFWIFVLVELSLFGYFILYPLSQLFKISKGLSKTKAANIIGRHFPEVNDKLLNLLQLGENFQQSDLLLASIEQKSKELDKIPFSAAVTYKSSTKYLKWAVIPVLFFLAIFVSGNASVFTESYARVVDFNTEFEPPAPFSFSLENDSLQIQENRDFKLRVKTIGEVQPEEVQINYDNQQYFLKQIEPGLFEYNFKRLKEDIDFQMISNGVASGIFTLEVLKVPALLNLDMQLNYPVYTGKSNEKLNGTGNASIPEGTRVTWSFKSRNTKNVNFVFSDSLVNLKTKENSADFSKQVFEDFDYVLSSSNSEIKNFEPVDYKLKVIKDEFPKIEVEQKIDSVNNTTQYFFGKVTDDYALYKLQLVYFSEKNEDELNRVDIPVASESFDEFHFTFPGNISLQKATNYNYYFEIFDNDGINGAKSSKSQTFSYREKSKEEIETESLKEQEESIRGMSESMEKIENSKRELEEISRNRMERKEFNYNEQKKLNNFLERQTQQQEMMKNYSEKLKKSLDEEKDTPDENSYKNNLEKRFDKNEEELEENEALLEELQKISDKISKEELGNKLEELSKKNQAQQRNMKQLLELTKRYYVEEKSRKLSRDLKKLGEKQESLSEDVEKNSKDKQEELNREFEDFKNEMDQLEKDNADLKMPSPLKRDKVDEEEIKKDQKDAGESLDKGDKKEAGKKQKDAGKKMKKMAAKMNQQMQMQAGEELDADIETLRQILHNLIRFSFQQEDLMDAFGSMNNDDPMFASRLNKQSDLRENFRHIDDSLYTLALKNPMIDEEISENLTDIEFDIEKALERLSENQIPQGISSQQYVVTRANNLALLLSDILSSLQQQANPQMGQGKGEREFQLPDIIKKQQKLQQNMKEGMKGQNQKPGESQKDSGGAGEMESEKLFEIYKQQQELRNEMQRILNEQEDDKQGENVRDEMQRIEDEILNKGFDPETLENMSNLIHDLLKYEKATIEQGRNKKRENETSKEEFDRPAQDQNSKAKEYFNSTEILNRQILPLRGIYKDKVKFYFEEE